MPKPPKRNQLVEATKELLREVGYEAMSPRDIQARSATKPGGSDEAAQQESSQDVPFCPGSFVLVKDTHGKGHISRHSTETQTVIWITLPNGLELPSG
jgi:hypothetical protein